jgi:hypothetical protein
LIPNLHWLHLQKVSQLFSGHKLEVNHHSNTPAWACAKDVSSPHPTNRFYRLQWRKEERERERHNGWTQYFGSNSTLMLIVWPMFPNRRTVSLCPFRATHLEDGGPGIMLYDLQRVFQVHQVPRAGDGIQVTLI